MLYFSCKLYIRTDLLSGFLRVLMAILYMYVSVFTALYVLIFKQMSALLQDHIDKKLVKVAWKSSFIADKQNYEQIQAVLQVYLGHNCSSVFLQTTDYCNSI